MTAARGALGHGRGTRESSPPLARRALACVRGRVGGTRGQVLPAADDGERDRDEGRNGERGGGAADPSPAVLLNPEPGVQRTEDETVSNHEPSHLTPTPPTLQMEFLADLNERQGASVKDVPSDVFIAALAEHFKSSDKFELPEWHDIVKTATFKELAPYNPDWYYVRAASIARVVYLHAGTGMGTFVKKYGGKERRGTCPNHFRKASGGNIRHILKQLEKNDIIAKHPKKKGRFITSNGQRELDTIAGQIVVTKSHE